MKSIEDGFQVVADQIVGGLRSLEQNQQSVISKFYALWRLRADHKEKPLSDITALGVLQEQLTLDQQEILEKNGYCFIGPNRILPGRMRASIVIQLGIRHFVQQLHRKRWGIALAKEGEFLVPDQFGTVAIVPVTPTLCLIAGCGNVMLSKAEVHELNRTARLTAREYVFARDFKSCP